MKNCILNIISINPRALNTVEGYRLRTRMVSVMKRYSENIRLKVIVFVRSENSARRAHITLGKVTLNR